MALPKSQVGFIDFVVMVRGVLPYTLFHGNWSLLISISFYFVAPFIAMGTASHLIATRHYPQEEPWLLAPFALRWWVHCCFYIHSSMPKYLQTDALGLTDVPIQNPLPFPEVRKMTLDDIKPVDVSGSAITFFF